MKQIKILLGVLVVTTIFSATGVFATNSINFLNAKIPVDTIPMTAMKEKMNHGTQSLTTKDSATEDHTSSFLLLLDRFKLEFMEDLLVIF